MSDENETRSRRAPTDFLIIVGGIAEPVAPAEFSRGWGTGLSAGFQTGRWLSKRLALAVGVDYSRFGIDVVNAGDVEIDGGTAQLLYGSVSLAVALSPDHRGAIAPALFVGLGFLGLVIDDATVGSFTIPGSFETTHGAHVGGRLAIRRFVLEAAYMRGFTEDESTTQVMLRAGVFVGKRHAGD